MHSAARYPGALLAALIQWKHSQVNATQAYRMPAGRGATVATSALLVVTAVTAIGIGYIHRTQRLEREVMTLVNTYDYYQKSYEGPACM
jgi:hypothetical protein